MEDYIINVAEIEELQTISNTSELDRIFEKARKNIIGGCRVILVRKRPGGATEKFDEMNSLDDFDNYKKWVYKNL